MMEEKPKKVSKTPERIHKMWIVLNDLRRNNELCDGEIQTDDGGSFRIHRHVLSAVSSYFRVMFSGQFSNADMRDVVIRDVKREDLECILDFIYTGRLKINEINAMNLFITSDRLLIDQVVIKCEQFFISQLSPRNSVDLYLLSLDFYCPLLKREVQKYILKYFNQVSRKCKEFSRLPAEELQTFLRDDNLNIRREEMAFYGALFWLEYAPRERKKIWSLEILPAVRFGLCSSKFLKYKVLLNEHVVENEDCKPMIESTAELLSSWTSSGKLLPIACKNYHFRPRVPQQIIFAIGGWSVGSATSIIETYDVRANRWLISKHGDVFLRAYHGIAYVSGCIYIIGGFDGRQCCGTVRSFDPNLKQWKERAPMHYVRCFVSAAVLSGFIYAIGGFNGHARSNTCEKYDPVKNQWTMITPMRIKRSDASAAAYNGRIYVAGGFNGQDVLNSVEMYNPKNNCWNMIAPMLTPRSGMCLINYKNHLYALGGYNGLSRLAKVDMYDYQLNTWLEMTEMKIARSNFATAVIEGLLFVIGGYDGFSTVYSVEAYNEKDSKWRRMSDMNFSRSALKCCTVTGLNNGYEYSFAGSLRNVPRAFPESGSGDQKIGSSASLDTSPFI